MDQRYAPLGSDTRMPKHIKHGLSACEINTMEGYLSWTHEFCPNCGGKFTFQQPSSTAFDRAVCLECCEWFHIARPGTAIPLKDMDDTVAPSLDSPGTAIPLVTLDTRGTAITLVKRKRWDDTGAPPLDSISKGADDAKGSSKRWCGWPCVRRASRSVT